MDYETTKRLARAPDPGTRRDIASRPGARPEILYYLAVDEAVEVRRAVAANPAAPVQASAVLARDGDESVRRLLADKLARLLPELDARGQERLFRLTVETLELLAADQALGVRQALATVLKDVACAPPAICLRLANDIAREVAEPILHYCATLTDEDLLDLVARQPGDWALRAVAARGRVTEPLSEAIHAAGDEEATRILIANPGARIADALLARMVEESVDRETWRLPLAQRPRLPPKLACRLAEFVDEHVLAALRQRPDLDEATAREVAATVRRRLDFLESQPPGETPEERVRRLHAAGRLDEGAIGDALSWNDLDFVRLALAVRAGLKPAVVDRILTAASPKGVTSLAWKAGLGMRGAMQLQARAAGIPPRLLLNARDGLDYPLDPAEMAWQIDFYSGE